MGLSEIFLVIQVGIFCFGFRYIFRIDRLFGLYFASLFIYCIFAQFGYRYYPNLSVTTNAYFGPEIWYPITIFIILSFTLFISFFVFQKPAPSPCAYCIGRPRLLPKVSSLFGLSPSLNSRRLAHFSRFIPLHFISLVPFASQTPVAPP